MIVSRIYLENYKQFHTPLELLPTEGAIGVVGPNGSGKTTIFEAILWAFFGARGGGPRFANDSIPWSGGSTKDASLVEVTVDVGGASYTVSRSLQRNKTTARVLGDGGMEVTSGPSEVAAWVQEHILGMDRTAFEATFFARQKELEFFAGTTGVERQREVARILRINQAEDAQKLLRNDKNDMLKEVRWIEHELAEADHDSLAADLKEQRDLHASLETKTKELRAEFEKVVKTLGEARAESERMEKLHRVHVRFSTDLERARHARERASDKAADSAAKLRALDEDAKKAAGLEPKTKGMEGIEAEISSLEEARRREERRSGSQKDLRRHHEAAYRSSRNASEMVESLGADGTKLLPEWPDASESRWDDDEVGLVREACRALEGANEAHLRSEAGHRGMEAALEKHAKLEGNLSRLEKGAPLIAEARAKVAGLDAGIEEVSEGGRLDARISDLRKSHESLQKEAAQKSGLAEAEDAEAKKMARARAMIEASDEHAECPTCQRGFEEDEHTAVIESLSRLESEALGKAEALRAERHRLDAEAAKASKAISAAEAAKTKLHDLRADRGVAASNVEKMVERFEDIEADVERLRGELGDAPKPTPEGIEAAEGRASRLRMLRDSLPSLSSHISEYERSMEAAKESEKEVEKLSEGDPYDEARHGELEEKRTEIRNILAEVRALENRLEERPAIEDDLEKSNAARATAAAEEKRLEEEIANLAFDEEAHGKAKARATEAEKARDASREARDESERELRGAEHIVAGLEKEVERHDSRRKEADEKASEAASLNDMDGLFSEFYRELTARVRPNLQREASDLIKTLTEGRYEKMEFDENYGVRLYDGLSDAYEISRFSGGEADIASLCARVALSKMISGKGSGALGFIVLDEVFGALDASRRQNVLLALDRLKRTFGQLFVISHVSDVQESVLFDETWFVEEDEEGKSSVRKVRKVRQEIGSPGSPVEAAGK